MEHNVTINNILEEQCRFMLGIERANKNVLQQVFEKYMNVRKEILYTFIRLDKAYDKMNTPELWNILY